MQVSAKGLMLAGALFVAAAGPASALDVWQGDMFVTAANATCQQNGFSANDFARAVLRPANVGTNGPDARFSLVGSRNAHRYATTGQFVAGRREKDYDGQIISSTAGFVSWSNTFKNASMEPATPTANTPVIRFTITITQYASIVGCVATLTGALTHRPGLD